MSCAIEMSKAGHDVHLVDIDADWKSYGAGITIQAPTFRALRQVGVADEVEAAGFSCRGARIRLADGTFLGESLTPALEPGLPDGGGILRPLLHGILARKTRAVGTRVDLGVTFSSIENTAREATVHFTNGDMGRYDLIVGADGINSKVRTLIFPNCSKPRFTGQGSFRTLAPRPAGLDMLEVYLGNQIKAGVTPISQEQLYMFTLCPEPSDEFFTPERQLCRLRDVLRDFAGLIGEIRDALGPESHIVYRPLQALLVQKPWHSGRIILIGDAVHATTPHLASGAGAAIEDGILLSHYVSISASIAEALHDFTERRFDRCRDVVESSVRLGELELAGASGEEHGRIYGEALARLAVAP